MSRTAPIMHHLIQESCWKSFGGFQKIYSFFSVELNCTTKFGIFIPPQVEIENKNVPVIYWLSGLTCSETNFIEKSGVQKYAAEHGVIIVNPDTSPRGLNLPGESDSWEFGVGAGFYVDATQEPWKNNYRMYSYVTKELIKVVNENFPIIEGKQSIMGHSMGGHGALICALKNPGLYKSVSAFSAICNPSTVRWGIQALTGYLGSNDSGNWSQWDATELAKKYDGTPIEILLEEGTDDKFASQLLPENLVKASEGRIPTTLNKREGYDHSYYFIASFIGEHIKFHMKHLKD